MDALPHRLASAQTDSLDADAEDESAAFASATDHYGSVSNMTYDVDKLISLNIFASFKGSIFHSKSLWLQTVTLGVVFWTMFIVMFHFRWEGFSKFVGKEKNNRAFLAMFSTLIGLLLSFYTALNLGRWWKIRLAIMDITEGARKLNMMLAHGVTSDHEVLHNVERYSRASIFLVFAMARRSPEDDTPRMLAFKAGFLTGEEADLLEKLSLHRTFLQAETLWVWLANVVSRLNVQGRTAGAPHYCALLAAVERGRQGIGDIQIYLQTPIPLGYVHLLAILVKLHNIVLTLLMSFACVQLAGKRDGVDEMGVFRTMFRAFFMPFLYNAMLELNGAVSNPFDDDFQDFDAKYLDAVIKHSSRSVSKAAEITPSRMALNRKHLPCDAAVVGREVV